MSRLISNRKSYEPNDIFKVTFWANEAGQRAINAKRNREKAEAIMLFGQTYFPEHFPSAHPKIHTDMLALMVADDKLKACAFPRGHAKSTVITFLLVLYRICFHERKFIVVVSDSEDKAKDFVVRIRSELEHNNKLKRDFTQNGEFKTTDWAKTDFTTSTGIRLVAKGAGQSCRGLIHEDTRPDMYALDDIETNETAGTDTIINFLLTDVLPSVNKRGYYDVCYVGTILRDMSCLHQMLINPEWASIKYECIDDDGKMIAPMLLPQAEYEKTKRMYNQLGKMSVFYSELHNNPMVADDELTFKPEYFQNHTIKDIPDGCKYFIAYDPALPPSGRTKIKAVDRTAIIVLATDSKENWYVVKVFANRNSPSENRKLLFSLVKKYSPDVVWMETISAQRGMYLEIQKEAREKEIKFPLREIPSHKGSKEARIEQLQPLYASGRIYHCDRQVDSEMQELERELMLFTRTPHDDRSDCLSFFINRVKYPRFSEEKKSRAYDSWDKLFNKDTSDSWKVV
jgi:predicted phage terminase large subunit-like protein